jgi:uncharacterized integral membrane protein
MTFIKIVFVTAVFLLLVLMGVHNRETVDFNLPPLMSKVVAQPAALMYFAFFAVGLITGALLSLGGRKESSRSK